MSKTEKVSDASLNETERILVIFKSFVSTVSKGKTLFSEIVEEKPCNDYFSISACSRIYIKQNVKRNFNILTGTLFEKLI